MNSQLFSVNQQKKPKKTTKKNNKQTNKRKKYRIAIIDDNNLVVCMKHEIDISTAIYTYIIQSVLGS